MDVSTDPPSSMLIPSILLTPPGTDLTENAYTRIVGTCVTLIILTIIAVGLRILSRILSQAGMWWDDWTIIITMFLSWGPSITMILATHYGFGKHTAALGALTSEGIDARLLAASNWFKLFYVFEHFYAACVSLAKISILLFYSRIFKTPGFQLSLWITGGFIVATWLASEVSIILECLPIHALWDFTPGAKCINLPAFFLGSGIPNILLNFVLLILPLPQIWSLQIEKYQKLALSGVFLLGSFVFVCSIIRVAILNELTEVDITWEFVSAGIWTCVEPCIAVVSACLPIMRSLWIRSRRVNSAQNGVKRSIKSIASVRSIKPEQKDIGSFTSRSHLNELSTEGELQWGNHVSIYATARRSEDRDIPMGSLNGVGKKNNNSGVSWLDDSKEPPAPPPKPRKPSKEGRNPAELPS
ncbi:hypothetical protein MMC25_001217 [Agyrium rufum]|nr:hypothetical protein [Agyrium rufum]